MLHAEKSEGLVDFHDVMDVVYRMTHTGMYHCTLHIILSCRLRVPKPRPLRHEIIVAWPHSHCNLCQFYDINHGCPGYTVHIPPSLAGQTFRGGRERLASETNNPLAPVFGVVYPGQPWFIYNS